MYLAPLTRIAFRSSTRFVKQFRYFSESKAKIKSSYYHERGTFRFSESTLGDLVDERAEDCGDKVAFSFPFQNITKTFYQFKEETDRLAAGLLSLGLAVGDRIAICGPNSYQWVLTKCAALKAGLIVVNINPASTEQELAYVLEKVKCQAIVTAESFKKTDRYKILCEAVPEILKSHPGHINSQRFKELKNVITFSDKDFPGAYRLQDVIQSDGSDARRLLNDARRKLEFDNPAVILFTSGTTGNPKAATISHFQVVNKTKTFINRAEFDKEEPVICVQVPLFHAFGFMGGPPVALLSKGKCVFPSEYFNPVESIKAIEQEKCTAVHGVPTMFNEMVQRLRNKQYDLRHWKKVIVGGSPVPLELMKILQNDFGLTIMNGYGATETCGAVSVQSQSESCRTIGSTGKPLEFVEIKIVNKQGHILPINTDGEVLARSPFTFTGYWDQLKETKEVFDDTRWYHTGDIGRMDDEGNIYITGRIKEVVIRGGENIYPAEVENILLTHSSIEDAYVIGVPDQKFGEELCASIKLKPGCTLKENELKEFCKDKISYFKIPRYILFCEDFPKTESGKITKHKLREECMIRLRM